MHRCLGVNICEPRQRPWGAMDSRAKRIRASPLDIMMAFMTSSGEPCPKQSFSQSANRRI